MFGKKEFDVCLQAYKRETSARGRDEFTSLRKSRDVFRDVRTKEDVESQTRAFIEIISLMNRGDYANRYVVQTFILEFCKYLEKDFLFGINTSRMFIVMKEKLKEFTGEIYEIRKKFTEAVAQHSLEHLLEDYGALLKFANLDGEHEYEGSGVWAGNKLW